MSYIYINKEYNLNTIVFKLYSLYMMMRVRAYNKEYDLNTNAYDDACALYIFDDSSYILFYI